MLKCREVAEESGDYIDRTMSRRRAFQTKIHLLLCGHCRRFVRHLHTAVSFFHRLPGAELSDNEARKIAESVREKAAKQQENGTP